MGIARDVSGTEKSPPLCHIFQRCIKHSAAHAFECYVNTRSIFVSQHLGHVLFTVIDDSVHSKGCRDCTFLSGTYRPNHMSPELLCKLNLRKKGKWRRRETTLSGEEEETEREGEEGYGGQEDGGRESDGGVIIRIPRSFQLPQLPP